MSKVIEVSVIIPLYNEEKYIVNCLESLKKQTFPLKNMEWILVDGQSTDKTVDLIQQYKLHNEYPIILLNNVKRKTPYALNMAIKQARGRYIIRLDAHASFYPDYIEKCVHYLETTDADNVGGIAETTSEGIKGKAISEMLSTKFGVGGSDFRVGEGNKYVDTVPFGAFRKDVFDRVGLFNTKLLRSEDNDMNARIREAGGKIWLAEDIRFRYYCRDTVGGILKMALLNGNALFHTLRENPKAMSFRHFIPFAFLMSLILMPILAMISSFLKWTFVFELVLYFALDAYFSFAKGRVEFGVITFWLYPAFHIVYGIGSLLGLFGITLY